MLHKDKLNEIVDRALPASLGVDRLDYILEGNLEKLSFTKTKEVEPLTYITTPARLRAAGVDYRQISDKYPDKFYYELQKRNPSIKGFMIYDPERNAILYDKGTGITELIHLVEHPPQYGRFVPTVDSYSKLKYETLPSFLEFFAAVDEDTCV